MARQVPTVYVVPMPPSVNGLWLNVPGRGRAKTDAYRAWLQEAGWLIRAQRPRPISGYVALSLRAGIAPRRRDLDNLLKPICDLLVQMGVIEDDSRIADLRARWDRDTPSGQVVVALRRTPAPERRWGSRHSAGRLTHHPSPSP